MCPGIIKKPRNGAVTYTGSVTLGHNRMDTIILVVMNANYFIYTKEAQTKKTYINAKRMSLK